MQFQTTAALWLAIACTSAQADALKSEADLRPFAESVMKKVAANDTKAAFALMQPYVAFGEAELQAAALSSAAQREQYSGRYGKAVGYEVLEERKVGNSLVRVLCIEKTEKHALPWVFYFYKSSSGWMLNSFVWNDNLPSVFSLKP